MEAVTPVMIGLVPVIHVVKKLRFGKALGGLS